MTLTAEQKNAEMTTERSILTGLLRSCLEDDFATLESTVLEYTRNHLDVSAADVLMQFKDGNKRTVLHFASCSQGGRRTILESILKASWLDASSRSTLIRLKDKDGLTPLMLAAQVENLQLAERNVLLLLEYAGGGPKLSLARSQAGATALHYAAGAGATSTCIRAIYENGPVALRTSSLQGGMPLHWACAVPPSPSRDHYEETVTALVDCGADLNASAEPNIPPPLHMCLAAGNERHAKLLLQQAKERSINLQPSLQYELPGGVNIFHMAADMNMVGLLASLLENDTSTSVDTTLLTKRSEEGLTPLEIAAREGHVGCVLLLLPLQDEKSEDDAKAFIAEFQAKHESSSPPAATTSLPPKPTPSEPSEPDTLEQKAQEEAAAILAQPNSTITDEMRARAQELKSEGNKHFAKKEFVPACELYSQAIEADPTDASFYSNRSACYMQRQQPENALHDAVVARTLKPGWSKAAYRMALARLELGRYEDAAVAAWEGLSQDQENDELKSLLQRCVKKGRQQHRQQKQQSHSSKGATTL